MSILQSCRIASPLPCLGFAYFCPSVWFPIALHYIVITPAVQQNRKTKYGKIHDRHGKCAIRHDAPHISPNCGTQGLRLLDEGRRERKYGKTKKRKTASNRRKRREHPEPPPRFGEPPHIAGRHAPLGGEAGREGNDGRTDGRGEERGGRFDSIRFCFGSLDGSRWMPATASGRLASLVPTGDRLGQACRYTRASPAWGRRRASSGCSR